MPSVVWRQPGSHHTICSWHPWREQASTGRRVGSGSFQTHTENQQTVRHRASLRKSSPRYLSGRGQVITAAVPVVRHQAPAAVQLSRPVVVLDNYDSFTYNLCQYLGDLGCLPVVFSNDEKSVHEIRSLNPAGILVSPGPGAPEDSGISLQLVQELGPSIPVFGVCMGHQCIGQVYGGRIVRAPSGVMHGKSSPVFHTGVGLLQGLDNPFQAARYHSLVIEKDSCPPELEVTAWTEDGTIMGVRHRQHLHVQGVQFHPESIITNNGIQIVRNFLQGLL